MSRPVNTLLAKPNKILRRSLMAPLANGSTAFVLPCRKLVIEYCETWGSAKGMRNLIRGGEGQIEDVRKNPLIILAKEYPGVEFVIRRKDNKHPLVTGVYSNGRSKPICVRNLDPPEILSKIDLLLNSSGDVIKPLKRPSVESGLLRGGWDEGVRGVWSGLH